MRNFLCFIAFLTYIPVNAGGIESFEATVLGSNCRHRGHAHAVGGNRTTAVYNEQVTLILGDGPLAQGWEWQSEVISESPGWTDLEYHVIETATGIFTDDIGGDKEVRINKHLCIMPPQPEEEEPSCGLCNTPGPSPIVIDLGQDDFHFGAPGQWVSFDLLGDGLPFELQWVAEDGNDAFLAIDLNGNGVVDNGSELFGNGTRLILENNQLAPNGFVGLSQYDDPALSGNDDGYITNLDSIWEVLVLWLDTNADGVSTPDEVFSVDEFGLTRLETIPREIGRRDPAGNWLRYTADSFDDNQTGHSKFKMVDVYFALPSEN